MLDSLRLIVLCSLILWAGLVLLLSELRWFQRIPLIARLRPYVGTSTAKQAPAVESFRSVLLPIAMSSGESVARLFGVRDDLATRLRRANLAMEAGAFRLRQLTWTAVGALGALLFGVALHLPTAAVLFFLAAAPLLAFLVFEQKVVSAIQIRRRRTLSELPIVAEQLTTLLGAGYSLGAALTRLAERNHGYIGTDLRLVCDRILQGLTVSAALKEWAETLDIAELYRLVSVLSFSSETNDLGRLVSAEASAIRQEAQRRLLETMDKRAQLVWVPVTVATLIPGVIFLCIPFLEALRQFSHS